MCSCNVEVESTTHFFLHCLCFSSIHKILFNELISICKKFIELPDSSKVELCLYGSPDLSFTQNSLIINASINYIIKSQCFKGNLFWTYFNPKLHLILSPVRWLQLNFFLCRPNPPPESVANQNNKTEFTNLLVWSLFFKITMKYIKNKNLVHLTNKGMLSVSHVTFVDIITQVSLTQWSIFLFLDVLLTQKLRIIII